MVEFYVMKGGCHCGRISISFSTVSSPDLLAPRACDCYFCKKHAATYVSDPSGELVVDVNGSDGLARYRQGSKTAEFLFCKNCGVLVAVVHEGDGTISAAVNARCLDEFEKLREPVIVSPQKLGREEKMARWGKAWTKKVQIRGGGA